MPETAIPHTLGFALTPPPSVNAMFSNVPGVGRVKTKKYRSWLKVAGWEVQIGMIGKRMIEGKFKATIHVAAAGDLDNRVKATLDLCQAIGAIRNDEDLIELHVYRKSGAPGLWVTLEAVP